MAGGTHAAPVVAGAVCAEASGDLVDAEGAHFGISNARHRKFPGLEELSPAAIALDASNRSASEAAP